MSRLAPRFSGNHCANPFYPVKTLPKILFCLGILLFATRVQAKHKHHPAASPAALATPASEPPPLPPEAAPAISPDAPPSASLQPFVDGHLSTILAPLGTSAFAQPEVITSLKASYADGLAAAPAPHQPAYQLAMGVLDVLTGAITERQNAVAALRGALATRSSEAAQPRGGAADGAEKARLDDAFFVDSQKNTWLQRATVLRQSVTALYLRERAVERQIGPWNPPAAPAGTVAAPSAPAVAAATPSVSAPLPAVAAATPSVSAPPAAAPEAPSRGWDPVIGQWLLEGRSSLTLGADHTISGDRHGTWYYTSTTNGGRNYELHWNPPKRWVDYLVLSGDGKTMGGKTRESKPISYFRP